MAIITSVAVSALLVRSVDVGMYAITGKPVLPAAAQGDQITLFTAPHAMRVHYSTVKVPAGMGAAATLAVRSNSNGVTTPRTVTSNANAVSVITSHSAGAFDLAAGDMIELVVGGGALSSGLIEYDFLCSRA